MVLTSSKFQQHPEGSFPENSAGTWGVAFPSLYYLPKLLHHHVGQGLALSNEAWISVLYGEGLLFQMHPSLKCFASASEMALGIVLPFTC